MFDLFCFSQIQYLKLMAFVMDLVAVCMLYFFFCSLAVCHEYILNFLCT